MEATQKFSRRIDGVKPIKKGESQVAVVGNRVDSRTLVADELETFLKSLGLPVFTYLRNTQNYIHCARDGYSLFDVAPSRVEQDLEQWKPLGRWLMRQAKMADARS